MEFVECIIGWGFDLNVYLDGADEVNVILSRPGRAEAPIRVSSPLTSLALRLAYDEARKVIQEERNAAREKTAVKEGAEAT